MFPYEYQRALAESVKEKEEEMKKASDKVDGPMVNGDAVMVNGHSDAQPNDSNNGGNKAIVDIEDAIPQSKPLDKTKGFVKYKRATYQVSQGVNY